MKAYNKFMEFFWMTIAIVTAIYGAYKINNEGLNDNYLLLVMPIVAAALSMLRRYVRLRAEKHEQQAK